MPLPRGGADLLMVRDKGNGLFDFNWDSTGNPLFTDDGSHYVMSLLLEFEGLWWADDTQKRGSLLYTVLQDKSDTLSLLQSYSDRALQQGVDAGRLVSFINKVTKQAPGKYQIVTNWVMPGSISGMLITPLGY